MRIAFRTAAALAIWAGSAAAQCKVANSSNEGKLLAFYSVPIVFSIATAPGIISAGAIRICVPRIPADTATRSNSSIVSSTYTG